MTGVAATPEAARLLDSSNGEDARVLAQLRSDPMIDFVDTWDHQVTSLGRLRPPPSADLVGEPPRFAYYPWRRAVVKILGPKSFRRLRLDRNRNLITAEEQDRLGRLRVGVIGLSSGHVVAHTVAMAGLCGELRLADNDDLELANLNRVPAGVLDLGLDKTTVVARRIAELDPYVRVRTTPTGVSADVIDDFLAGLDVVIEQCDSLDVKVMVRHAAREHRLPVLMATSDRGLVDVERFDIDPDRPIFHGLLGDVDPDTLAGLSANDKVPYVLRLIEVGGLSARGAASLLEVGHTVTTWPQLAGDVTLGAGAVAEAVRRIGLCQPLSSGRIRMDAGAALQDIDSSVDTAVVGRRDLARDPSPSGPAGDFLNAVAAAAARAPSGGNAQPWRVVASTDGVTVQLAPERTSIIDVGLRGSAVAVGAAAYNARVAAAAHGFLSWMEFAEPTETSPLTLRVRFGEGTDDALAGKYDAMVARETNRNHGTGAALAPGVSDELFAAAQANGAELRLLETRPEIAAVADVFADADRIRYLTPGLHAEMISELRWPGDEDPDTGIDVRSLELGMRGDVALEVLRRADVMAELSVWGGGQALGEDTAKGLLASSAVAVLTVDGQELVDYARGGSAVEATWIVAEEFGLAVQPISPPFLYATNDEDLRDVAPKHAEALADLRSRFRDVAGIGASESLVLVLRLSLAPSASTRSRRRGVKMTAPPLP